MGMEFKEAVDWTMAHWPVITGTAAGVGTTALAAKAGLKHLFNVKSGVYGVDRNGQCQERLREHDEAAEQILRNNSNIKSVMSGHAEGVYYSRRSDENPEQIDNGGLILNIPSNIVRLYMAFGKLDDSKKILHIMTHPIDEDSVPKSVRNAAKKVGNGYAFNPLKKLVNSFVPVQDKKQELSENMIRTEHLWLKSRESLCRFRVVYFLFGAKMGRACIWSFFPPMNRCGIY